MKLLEATFGTDVTTRTWDTVKKCAKGGVLGAAQLFQGAAWQAATNF